MLFDFAKLTTQHQYRLLTSTIVPRPIAWVVSMTAAGRTNAAPFSYFNMFSEAPPIIGIGINARPEGAPKDTARNIIETGTFTVNMVSEETMPAMNITAADFPPDQSEIDAAGIATAPSHAITVPRIAASPVAFECRMTQAVELSPLRYLILGQVLAAHVRDADVLDAAACRVNTPALHLVGRMHGRGFYTRTSSDLIEMDRISYKEYRASRG